MTEQGSVLVGSLGREGHLTLLPTLQGDKVLQGVLHTGLYNAL